MLTGKILIVPKQIITANISDEILNNHAVEISDGKITKIISTDKIDLKTYDGKIFNYPDYVLTPGFIQTHVHLCQTLFRGLADDLLLLDWLQSRIFPYENKHSKESLRASARLGIHELQSGGTTTIVDMGTINHQEVIFDELIFSGMRGFAGKCMVDMNDMLPEFKEDTKDSLTQSYEFAKEFHNSQNGRIKYAFAPRFVLSCTEELMKETAEMKKDFAGSLFHSHASENLGEVEVVRKMYNKENIEYFESIGVLDDSSLLAHCIHLNKNEIGILKSTGTRVAHCPSANLKLGSGIANIPEYLNRDISVSLGADGPPCNNNMSIFNEMRLAALIQKPAHGPTVMDAKTVFRLATIDGAKALHIENETGSIEIGKEADLVLLDLNKSSQPLLNGDENLYSSIVYSTNTSAVKEVMIGGEWVVQNSDSIIYDENEIIDDGKSELNKLLERVN